MRRSYLGSGGGYHAHGVFIPCATADGQCVAAENRAHPVMKCTKPHVAGQRGQITLFFERRIDGDTLHPSQSAVRSADPSLNEGGLE